MSLPTGTKTYRVITNCGSSDCNGNNSSSILVEYHIVNADWSDYYILKTDVAVKVGIV